MPTHLPLTQACKIQHGETSTPINPEAHCFIMKGSWQRGNEMPLQESLGDSSAGGRKLPAQGQCGPILQLLREGSWHLQSEEE